MSTKVVTGLARFSYAYIFKPSTLSEKYEVTLLIPKSDKVTVKKLKAAIEEATQEGVSGKWGGKRPGGLWNPLKDGDEADDPAYEGMYFVHAKSNNKPGVVDKDLDPILDPEEVYSGCWGRASISFYPFDNSGNKGVACALNNIQKIKDDERFGGGRASAEDDFADGFDDYEDYEDEDL